jgi:hypothetical protein
MGFIGSNSVFSFDIGTASTHQAWSGWPRMACMPDGISSCRGRKLFRMGETVKLAVATTVCLQNPVAKFRPRMTAKDRQPQKHGRQQHVRP